MLFLVQSFLEFSDSNQQTLDSFPRKTGRTYQAKSYKSTPTKVRRIEWYAVHSGKAGSISKHPNKRLINRDLYIEIRFTKLLRYGLYLNLHKIDDSGICQLHFSLLYCFNCFTHNIQHFLVQTANKSYNQVFKLVVRFNTINKGTSSLELISKKVH